MIVEVDCIRWFALQVAVLSEARISVLLRQKAYPVFLPAFSVTRKYADRTKKVEVPLYAGYLFCRFDPQLSLDVRTTPGVIRIVHVANVPAEVPESEIESIRALLSSGLPIQPISHPGVGEQIEVTHGPLRGVRGVVVSADGGLQLVVTLTLLNRSVCVQFDTSAVRAVPASFSHTQQKPQALRS